jgi:nucleoside-diphosphate-sugar epimerase
MALNTSTILITGGAGFIGSHTVVELREDAPGPPAKDGMKKS